MYFSLLREELWKEIIYILIYVLYVLWKISRSQMLVIEKKQQQQHLQFKNDLKIYWTDKYRLNDEGLKSSI